MLKKIARMLFGKPAKTGKPSSGEHSPAATTHKSPASGSEHDSTEHLRMRSSTARNRQSPAPQRTRQGSSSNRFGELAQLDLTKATIIPREEHNISRRDISPGALKVLYKLNDSGYQAFLVGGGVRDLLLGGHPKDFDISTDATPEQVKDLFRSARVVGRRFKIAHVRFGREIIEVTTFRAHHEIETEVDEGESRRHIRDLDSAHSSSGMILRDNVYGSINEDALRRDFTVNALYYTTNGFHLLDFVNGLSDIEQRLIRMIGDPDKRYREDPVRILRAIRLAAKLNFRIEPATEAPLHKLAHLLESIAPARLFDESVKLFTNGEAQATFALLRKYGVADYLFKPVLGFLDDPDSVDSKLIEFALHNTDQRLAEGKSVTPAFLYAALLWPELRHALLDEAGNRPPPMPLIQQEASEVISRQLRYTAIPKRLTAIMREIWELQWRLTPRSARQIESVVAHPRFRAAYDFVLLREAAGEDLGGIGDWWTRFQLGDRSEQERMIAELQPVRSPRKGRRKPRSSKDAVD